MQQRSEPGIHFATCASEQRRKMDYNEHPVVTGAEGISGAKPAGQRGRPAPTAESRRILDPQQAAALFHCDDKTITRWARMGYVPAHPMGQGKKKYWRFFEDELIGWLNDQKNGAVAA